MTDYAAYTGGPQHTFARHDNVAPSPQIAFQPIIDLDTGTVVAVSAPAPMGHISELESDVDRAILAAHATSQRETLLPLHVFLRAQTLTDDRSMDHLHRTLTGLGRRPGGVIVSVSGLFGAMPLAEAAGRLGRLRAIGYLIGIERVEDLPSRFVAEVAPSVLTLDPELSRRASADPRRAALVDGLVSMGRRTGGHVLAPGIVDEEQLTKLRGLGVRLAQGPLLAPPDWRPGHTRQRPPRPAGGRPARPPGHASSCCPRPSCPRTPRRKRCSPRSTPSRTPRAWCSWTRRNGRGTRSTARGSCSSSPGRTGTPCTRTSRPTGWPTHRGRCRARCPRSRRCGPRAMTPARVYDDLVVVDEVGRCMGIARVGDLIRSLSELERRTAS